MKTKLTPWFPPHIKPVRFGVYMVEYFKGIESYALWNGREWGLSYSRSGVKNDIYFAYRAVGRNPKQNLPWRGLVKRG